MDIRIKVRKKRPGIYTVSLAGHLDSDNYHLLKQRLDDVRKHRIRVLIFDMKELEYISSAGLGVIFSAFSEIEGRGGLVILSDLQPGIRKIFDIMNMLPDKPVFENMREVDRYLDAIQKKERSEQDLGGADRPRGERSQ